MLHKLNIATRLNLFVAAMVLLILFIGGFSIYEMRKTIFEMEKNHHGGVIALNKVAEIIATYARNVLSIVEQIGNNTHSWDEGAIKLDEGVNIINNNWKEYDEITKGTKELKVATQTKLMLFNIVLPSLEKLKNIINRQDLEALKRYQNEELYQTFDPFRKQIGSLRNIIVTDTEEEFLYTLQEIRYSIYITATVIILSFLLALFIGFYLPHTIVGPLRKSIDAIKRAALGDTSQDILLLEGDQSEIGELSSATKQLNDTTKQMIGALEGGDLNATVQPRSDKDALALAINGIINKLRHTITQVNSEIACLTSSTAEILTSVSQVSVGTAETAAAISETTTTMEELKQTAHVAADKAKDVLSSSEATLQVVQTSEKSLNAIIEDMHQIEDKMRIISESIVKLSEQSSIIGDIINTVNDLAEQSNLLAVNAAIEAAKAGEQGKGFGVVAQEIRILAEQSKAATVQVRAILNDIQNATSAAVLATEQGSKAVGKGVNQSVETQNAINFFIESLSKVAQAANQISISSQQQLIGVDQVAVAMTNIDEASNQHVNHMKQIEESVSSLNDVGVTLKNMTGQYITGISESNGAFIRQSHINTPSHTHSIAKR